MEFLGQMEQFISSNKNGSKYDAVPFVKNNPVELGGLGRLVPRFTKSLTVGERMARVRFLQMVVVQLIPVMSFETKRKSNSFEGIPSILENFRLVELFHLTFHPPKNVFSVQMVSVQYQVSFIFN